METPLIFMQLWRMFIYKNVYKQITILIIYEECVVSLILQKNSCVIIPFILCLSLIANQLANV